jgi:hypothetical protein
VGVRDFTSEGERLKENDDTIQSDPHSIALPEFIKRQLDIADGTQISAEVADLPLAHSIQLRPVSAEFLAVRDHR